ncbi:MAG: MBOAT family protein [Paludibacter sp.]|nr:MBOAT family protein [Bacteroidales bacterium]MCM1069080.1 MBOAT family protein [Prevotella sp.]MCM1353519.1 MBOAT family protein [Bacteroides sp.]MCM1442680.1 MBOAT family protein [Muribaculum sp.]MCM1481684.1 MBOAT family protein [Paludibacter sp.]
MLFNSIEFALFLPIVFLLYWFLFDYAIRGSRHRLLYQNLFIVIVSYLFYGWWNWRFLFLIAFVSLCSYGSGLLIVRALRPKVWLTINIVINLAVLGVFKYYDFFITSFAELIGTNPSGLVLNIVLPVGISFYTFQALSYSIDVYRKKIPATSDVVAFFAYVSFFPQLVAGPIERATNLLPQFQSKRTFDYTESVSGMRLILWGLFKKMVIADNCAIYVDQVFVSYNTYSASTLILAALLFSFQIYGDFSGYSDIAIGTARLFGIRLMPNFHLPYFSRNVAEFWKRWHISLNTWFVDYVYIPLGGSRAGSWKTIRNTFIIFLLSGLWHGANYTYLAWGMYHALLFIPLIFLGHTRRYTSSPTFKHAPQMLLTFLLIVIGWIIFRAPSVDVALDYFCRIFDRSILSIPYLMNRSFYLSISLSLAILFVVEWCMRGNMATNLCANLFIASRTMRWLCYLALIVCIYFFGKFDYTQFIYFQF